MRSRSPLSPPQSRPGRRSRPRRERRSPRLARRSSSIHSHVRFRSVRTEARFPGLDQGAAHYESFYLKATRPGGGQARLDPPHGPQAPRARTLERLAVVHALRRRGGGPRATKVTVDAAQVEAGDGDLHRGRRRVARRRRRPRRGADGRARCELGPAVRAGAARVPPPPVLVPLLGPAAEDEAALALSQHPLQRHGDRSTARSSRSTRGRAWSATTGDPSTPSAGSGWRRTSSARATAGSTPASGGSRSGR